MSFDWVIDVARKLCFGALRISDLRKLQYNEYVPKQTCKKMSEGTSIFLMETVPTGFVPIAAKSVYEIALQVSRITFNFDFGWSRTTI